jgi:putative flavoprotein involved in K+ transport
MTRTAEHRDVVVVGGGQAGLAIGYYLAQQNRNFTILEAAGQPAAAWRERWDSLRLFTPVRYDALPDKSFPGDPDSYPGRDDVVDYLTGYAEHVDLPVELNSPVSSIEVGDGGYVVETEGRSYEAGQVVVATGPFQVPRVPAIAEQLRDAVVHFHSSEYRQPASIPPGPVLVVGGGNTGFQIAEELAATHEVHLSIGSRQMPLPQRIFGRDLFTFLTRTGLMGKSVETRLARRLKDRETLIGSSPRSLRRKHGVTLRPRATAASGSTVSFEDGSALEVSSVIWATGFGLDHSFVHAPVFDERGQVIHRRGVTDSPGLYFIGLPWLHTRGSALLGWVKDDAQFLAERIRERAGGTRLRPAPTAPLPTGERA